MMENKLHQMNALAEYRKDILPHPPLKNLFLELTLRCNEHCMHCGSSCGEAASDELSYDQYKKILDDIKSDFDIKSFMLSVTGGEPLIRRDFFEIMGYACKLGYRWGMTSNGTLINSQVAEKLYECCMKTISISIDGLEETHDWYRGKKGAYKAAMNGLNALICFGKFEHIQITTVINHYNICELQDMFEIFKNMDIGSWRVINIEPIGRANSHPDLFLSRDEYLKLFDFIKSKRIEGYPVTYGCSHFLGAEYERQVRDWFFLCNAGLYTASIMSNGDIGACLDIERRPSLIQGNILKDNLKYVWENKFEIFRRNLSDNNAVCRNCPDNVFCHGGSYHSWDYDNNKPLVCFKDILF